MCLAETRIHCIFDCLQFISSAGSLNLFLPRLFAQHWVVWSRPLVFQPPSLRSSASRELLSFFSIRLGFAEHFPQTSYLFFVVLLRAWLFLLKNILLIVFFFFLARYLSTNHLYLLGVLETYLFLGSQLSNPASPCTAWFFYHLPIFIASHSLAFFAYLHL